MCVFAPDSKPTLGSLILRPLRGSITVDELVGTLITHEQILAQLDKEENKTKNEKPIALKAIASDSSEQESGSDEEEISLLTRRFHKFLKKKKRNFEPRRNKNQKENTSKSSEIICYDCKKLGHIKWECPTLKNSKEKKEVKDDRSTCQVIFQLRKYF